MLVREFIKMTIILVTNGDNIIGNNFQIVTYGTINYFGNYRNLLKKNIVE